MKNERRTALADRRKGNERRIYRNQLGFPFVDSHGQLVTEDRRVQKERRVSADATPDMDETPEALHKLSRQTA